MLSVRKVIPAKSRLIENGRWLCPSLLVASDDVQLGRHQHIPLYTRRRLSLRPRLWTQPRRARGLPWRPRTPASSLASRYHPPWASNSPSCTARTHLFSLRAFPPPSRLAHIIRFPCKASIPFRHLFKPTSSPGNQLWVLRDPACTVRTQASYSWQRRVFCLHLEYP